MHRIAHPGTTALDGQPVTPASGTRHTPAGSPSETRQFECPAHHATRIDPRRERGPRYSYLGLWSGQGPAVWNVPESTLPDLARIGKTGFACVRQYIPTYKPRVANLWSEPGGEDVAGRVPACRGSI